MHQQAVSTLAMSSGSQLCEGVLCPHAPHGACCSSQERDFSEAPEQTQSFTCWLLHCPCAARGPSAGTQDGRKVLGGWLLADGCVPDAVAASTTIQEASEANGKQAASAGQTG